MPSAECLADQGVRNMRVREPGVVRCLEMRASAVTVAHGRGFGREMGMPALNHYTKTKTVWVDLNQ
jgi:hypothetical protein